MDNQPESDTDPDLTSEIMVPPEQEPEPPEPMENLPEPGVDFPENFDRTAEPTSSRRFYRLGTYGLGALILGMVLYVVIAENWSMAKKLNPGIDDLVESLDRGGFTVGFVKDLPDRNGAMAAKQVVLEGHPVCIYQFAINTDKQQKQLLEEIARAKTIKVGGVDVPAMVHGPFVLTHWEDAPYRDDLVRLYLAFGSFGTRTETQEHAAADQAAGQASEPPKEQTTPEESGKP